MKAVPLAIVMLAVLGASMFVLVDSDEIDGADLTIGVAVSSGSVGMGSVQVYDVTASTMLYNSSSTTVSEVTIPSGHQFYIYAVASSNYEFVEWRDAQNNYLIAENPIYSDASSQFDDDLLAVFQEKTTANYNLTFSPNYAGRGSVSISSLTVPSGTPYSSNGNALTVGSTTIIATASPGYKFDYWNPSQGSISRNQAFSAVFSVDSSSLTIGVAVSPYSTGTGSVMVYDVTASTELYNSSSTTLAEVTIPGGHQFYIQAVPSADSNFTEWRDAQNNYLIAENPIRTDTTAQFDDDLFAFFDGPTTYTLTFQASTGGTLEDTYGNADTEIGILVPAGTTYTARNNRIEFVGMNGENVAVVAYPDSGYAFDRWSSTSGTVNVDTTITAYFNAPTTYTLTFQASTGGTLEDTYGNADTEIGILVPAGTTYTARNNRIEFVGMNGENVAVVAYPDSGYAFDRWSFTSGTVDDDMTITAYFSSLESGVHWSNENFNGKVDILFSFRSGTEHTVTADLYSGTVDDNGLTTWAPSGYKMEVTLSFTNTLHAEAKILRNGAVWSGHAGVSDPGAWSRVLLSLDSENGRITLTPVRSFTSFTSFSLYESQERVIIDWPETTTGTATSVITHEDDGSDHARFAVVATRPFLNSYGVILYNPTINVRDFFPQYDSVRLNLYSFALYGTSMTINGHTWPVTDGKVTVQYVDLGDNQHFTPDADPTSPVKTRTFSLSNIYITWDNGRAALTFVDNRFTLDLGTYPLNQETMSFEGLWYFTTMLYEPYTATEKTLSDWKPFPETSAQQMILIFMGVTLIAGVAGMVHVRRTGRGVVDMVVIGMALLVAFIMLGSWYRCYLSSTSRI